MAQLMPDKGAQMPKFTRAGAGGGGANRFKPTEKPKNAKGTFLRLMKLFLRQKKLLFVCVFLTMLTAAIGVSLPYLIGAAINTFDITANQIVGAAFQTILLMLFAAYMTVYLIDTVSGVLMAYVSQKLIQSIRQLFFEKLQRLPLLFFDTTAHGDTMSRLTNDVDNISGTVAQTTTQLISSIISIGGALIMMLVLSPLLTLVAMIAIPLVFLLTKGIAKRSRSYFLGQQRALGKLGGILEESIGGLQIVKAFNHQEHILKEFGAVNEELKGYAIKANTWSGFLMPLMNVINNLSFTFIACIGGLLTVAGVVNVGVVVSFTTYSKQFGQPLNNIAGMFNTIQSALAGAERVFEILDTAEEASDKEQLLPFENPKGDVRFEGVSFSYTGEKSVLDHISFSVHAGQVVALVGETGAGKTTIVNLLTRFYEVQEGDIFVDDVNIKDIARADLRKCFSVVLQDTCLFSGTIAENIRYSKPDATREEILGAAKLTGADDFITKLPMGYETVISGSTDNLSQGQRQLLSISRAILHYAPILIFDEATSSVDTRTEKKIQRAMIRLSERRTCFMIAHRLSTIKDADVIMVVADGGIAESGTHDELMEKRGKYYEMVQSQLAGVGEQQG